MATELFLRFVGRNLGLCALVGAGSGLLCFFLAAIFPGMAVEDAASVSSSWPDLMKKIFGDPLFAFTDIRAWLNLEVFHITFWLIHGGLAAFLAARILATEVEEKTVDILLSIPISRARILAIRLAALASLSVFAALPVIVGCGLGIFALGLPIHPAPLVLATCSGTLLSLVIAGLALLVSVWVPRQTHCMVAALGLIGWLFLVEEMLVDLVPLFRSVAPLNPFHYYRAADILVRNSGAGCGPGVLLAMFLALAALAMAGFARRDLPA
jgi:ABC-2 type transport system permease protein